MACTTPLSSTHYHAIFSNPSKFPNFRPNSHNPIQLRPISSNKNPPNLTNSDKKRSRFRVFVRQTKSTKTGDVSEQSESQQSEIECIGTGTEVECVVNENSERNDEELGLGLGLIGNLWEWAVLISPFFFWGTAMVAMKEVLPKVGPFFVASFRLIPAGLLLVGFAAAKGRSLPSGFNAWASISLFAIVDATCFQGFLAEGLLRTTAGLGSVIIDSQPLTVAVLAAFLFGESIGYVGAAGLVLGVVGLLLLELPVIAIDGTDFSLWGSGEWWMLLSAQSMAIGTVMVRWVSKFSDPIMATGWHMLLGGLPLVALSILNNDPAFNGSLNELSASDFSALFYTSIFGSAVSYGVFFYNATRGSLTKLSSLTFLTPMFASVFGFLYLGESFSNVQLVGAFVTLVAIYMVNYKKSTVE
ncbi:WAT1-related protein At3g02690, chloroplastic-like [Chenopodium quinoa]|uniref:WAT1-related protein At3g02690, chloroplastic-like n=1 Tax=Chenopodium quinoa TaxID=63459 RepID=UPI000B781396|nr:WAT1-related protein At3g02690, chloroplastic-like [Chenopodium quinoa]